MNEKLAAELVDAIATAVENSRTLAITTGDEEFAVLAALLTMLLVAKTKGDLDAIAAAVLPVLSASMNKNNAAEDLLRGLNFN
jgi:cell division protein ZapA (FtsZ GTPase activity inhibitor)